jgi:transposase
MTKRLDRSILQARRIEGGKLLQRGIRPAEVARRLGVSRTSVMRWERTIASGGRRSLRGAARTGRPSLLGPDEQKRLMAGLKAGARAQGYSTDLWTLARVGKLIETLTGQRYCESGVWRLLKRLGFSSQRPSRRAAQRDEAAVWQWKAKRWPALKKSAPRNAELLSS